MPMPSSSISSNASVRCTFDDLAAVCTLRSSSRMACSSSRMRDLGTPNGGAFPAESSFLGGGRAGGFLLGFLLDGSSSSSSSRSSEIMPSSRFSGTERSLPIGTLPAERLLEEDLDARDPERGAMFILAVEVNALLEAEVPTLLVVFDLSFVSDMVLLLLDPSMTNGG